MSEFFLGDHLSVKRFGYTHHGIYIGNDEVVHFTSDNKSSDWFKALRSGSPDSASIRRTSLDEFANGGDVVYHIYSDFRRTTFPPLRVIERAKKRLGERGYNLYKNNCEHLTTWCKAGRLFSEQVSKMVQNVKDISKCSLQSLLSELHPIFSIPGILIVEYAFSESDVDQYEIISAIGKDIAADFSVHAAKLNETHALKGYFDTEIEADLRQSHDEDEYESMALVAYCRCRHSWEDHPDLWIVTPRQIVLPNREGRYGGFFSILYHYVAYIEACGDCIRFHLSNGKYQFVKTHPDDTEAICTFLADGLLGKPVE